jgi:TonB family protein
MKTIGIILFILFFSLSSNHFVPINITSSITDTIECVAHDTAVQIAVEKNAEFENGDILKFRKYVMSNIVMPTDALINRYQGRSFIKFIVDWDGQVKNVVVYKSSGYKILDNEAVRVIKKSPGWTSAKIANICVPQQFVLSIDFINLGVTGRQNY